MRKSSVDGNASLTRDVRGERSDRKLSCTDSNNHSGHPWCAEKHLNTLNHDVDGLKSRRSQQVLLLPAINRKLMLQWARTHPNWTRDVQFWWNCPHSDVWHEHGEVSSFLLLHDWLDGKLKSWTSRCSHEIGQWVYVTAYYSVCVWFFITAAFQSNITPFRRFILLEKRTTVLYEVLG